MKLPETSEQVLHVGAVLAQLPPNATVSGGALAEHFAVAAPYLSKQLAKLVRAGILQASTGPRGGFRLTRSPERVTVLDLVTAVDGAADPYVCREIRQQGRGAARPEDCTETCGLAVVMQTAHEAWKASLAAVTLADIVAGLPATVLEKNRRLLLD